MKIIFYVGSEVTSDTVFTKGYIDETSNPMTIKSEFGQIILNHIQSVTTLRVHGGGTIISLVNNGNNIFIDVPRIYIEKGSGFAISNYFKTRKLKKMIEKTVDNKANR